jgi:hypothetical protein
MDQGASVIVSTASPRTYIAPTDTDNNGVSDWEEQWADTFPRLETPPASETATATPYTPPTTLTGRFGQLLFSDFMERKMSGQPVDAAAMVEESVAALDEAVASREYTRRDLVIQPVRGPDDLRAYGNTLSENIVVTMLAKGQTNEAQLLKEALESNDRQRLEAITLSREAYTKVVDSLLKQPVPETVVPEHLAVTNAFEAVRSDIAAMELAFEDPLLAITRLRNYQANVAALGGSLNQLGNALAMNEIVFAKDEAGTFLYFFGQFESEE